MLMMGKVEVAGKISFEIQSFCKCEDSRASLILTPGLDFWEEEQNNIYNFCHLQV
jgi:hypothetical protein